jgi:hypothetical protein
MSRSGFQKSVRMFHKFSEETMRRNGGTQTARESIVALAAIEATLKAERPFAPELLEPLAAFTNLLQSSQLPSEFGDYSLGDALLAIEDAHAELRGSDEQRWEFEPELTPEVAAKLAPFAKVPSSAALDGSHVQKLSRFVLEAARKSEPGSALVVGALASPELPFAELAARFQRLTLNDVDLERLEELTRRVVPEQHRDRIKLERYDATGSYGGFTRGVDAAMNLESQAEAEQALLGLLASYDVGSGSAGLSASEEKPDLAISAQVLPELGRVFAPYVSAAAHARGWDERLAERPPVSVALTFLRNLLVQHHIHALLRRARSAVLVSGVSEVELSELPNGKKTANGEPTDLLAVERLVERIPQIGEIKAEQSWERQDPLPAGPEKRSLLTLVEAVLV